MPEETEFARYLTPEQYQARNVGRGQVLEDLDTLQRLQQTGGPAVQEARALQQEQAKGQIALQRGMDTGGRGERMGTEAAAKSHVEAEAPIAMIKEAATQGYAREEVGAAGLLAMSDTQFKQAIKGFLGEEKRRQMRQGQGKTAAIISGGASGAAMGSTFGPVGAIFGGLGGAALAAAKTGGVVPGVGSEDIVPARLTPGEIVIPKELSAQLMEVMSRSVGGGDVVRAQTGGVVRRDPQTGYLVEDQNAMALQKLATLAPPDLYIRPARQGDDTTHQGPIRGVDPYLRRPPAPPAMPQPVYDVPRVKSAAERAWDKGTSAGGWVLLPNSPDERGLYHYGHRKTGKMVADKRPPEEFFKATEKSGKGRK